MSRRRRRPTLLLLWSANGDPVERIEARDLRANAPFVLWDSLRYERVPRQSDTARIVHYQTRTLIARSIPQPENCSCMLSTSRLK